MASSTPTTVAVDKKSIGPPGSTTSRPRLRVRPIPATLVSAILVALGYSAYQRVGTTANANLVEYTRNYGGGFVAVGLTKTEPGFVVLSALDQPFVDIITQQSINRLAGTHTVVEVKAKGRVWRKRLRGPEWVVVDQAGNIQAAPVVWSFADFTTIRAGIDCNHGGQSKRCGAPFTDLHRLLSGWPPQRVPDKVRDFLSPHADRRQNAKKSL